MTYQKISGTLSANAHGSYSTQDALGDLLITEKQYDRKLGDRKRANTRRFMPVKGSIENIKLYGRSRKDHYKGGMNKWITIAIMW